MVWEERLRAFKVPVSNDTSVINSKPTAPRSYTFINVIKPYKSSKLVLSFLVH